MAIMSAIVVYVIPALIGRAYDLKNETVGPDIFNRKDVENNIRRIERHMTTSEYKVVSELSEAADFLHVSGKLGLKLKSGILDIQGTGNYLKESRSFENKIDLLVKVHYETVIETLPIEVTPLPPWQSTLEGVDMTHYIRSIRYGGNLIASVRFTAKNEADKMSIKAAVQGELNSKSGSFGAGLKGSLKKIEEKIGDTASMDINYYATVPLESVPRTIDGLTDLVDKFPEQTKKVNNGTGVPLSMEIYSLEVLGKDRTTYWQSLALADQMVVLDEQFSDVTTTKRRLADWLKTVPPVLPVEEKEKIGMFQTKLDNMERIFADTIANLDLSHKVTGEQFKPAFHAYLGDKPEAIPNMYIKELSKLKTDVLSKTESFEADFGGAHYTYWGSEDCPSGAKLIDRGLMYTTSGGAGSIGSSDFSCMSHETEYPKKPDGKTDDDIEDFPQLLPATYLSRRNAEPAFEKLINCVRCRIPGKSSQTLIISKECPDGWTEQYQGILISTSYNQTRGDLVCLDTTKRFPDKPGGLEESTVVTDVSPKCGGEYPCEIEGPIKSFSVPCVVCSIVRKPSN